ncbi:hypothetical protein [Thermoanaerobacterium sp. DL9XJH110]|uniref:hypothetical protein n=1 Tax=Thermoanaerobacterium sp. DL9XJH110 TaxID=3386643 RepID=UPI003BB5E1A4
MKTNTAPPVQRPPKEKAGTTQPRCWYCYANYEKETATKNFQQHDPDSEFLLNRKIKVIKELTEGEKEKEPQLSLF